MSAARFAALEEHRTVLARIYELAELGEPPTLEALAGDGITLARTSAIVRDLEHMHAIEPGRFASPRRDTVLTIRRCAELAAWCPRHGACTCPAGEELAVSDLCPLHGNNGHHQRGAPAGLLEQFAPTAVTVVRLPAMHDDDRAELLEVLAVALEDALGAQGRTEATLVVLGPEPVALIALHPA